MKKKGILLVSHSKKLAEGLKELVEEMADESLEIVAVGGTDDGRLGTSATKIAGAIESLEDALFILIYADLGSSILSAETALDLIDEDLAEKVTIVNAPLVEGAFAGVVHACGCDTCDEIIKVSEEIKDFDKI